MEYTLKLDDLNRNRADIAGGKGASLGEMINVGICVPDGFVVLSDTFNNFLKLTDLNQEIDTILHSIDHHAIHTIDSASEKIKALILSREISTNIQDEILKSFDCLNTESVAIRSSATAEDGADHAWAGQLESYLNVKREDVIERVQHCWASLFTPRAIFYRFEKGMHAMDISVAVVVQKMVDSEVSGIAFSVHPITEDTNQIAIEAVFGLGEAIVSGAVIPDTYVVEKEPRRIIDINTSTQERELIRSNEIGERTKWQGIQKFGFENQKLSEDQILELANLVLLIERHYGFPCDIEWALENGKFYILQARPITTLSQSPLPKTIKYPDLADYIRLFEVSGIPFFVSDTLSYNYRRLNALFFLHKGYWSSYLPKETLKITYKEAEELFTSKEGFEEYREKFDSYKKESEEFFRETLSKKSLSKEEARKTLGYFIEMHRFYIKTEFFYTDRAYELENDQVVSDNLAQMDYVKNTGREHLNKIFFGESAWINRFIGIISEQFGIEVSLANQLSHQEILSLFDDKKVNLDILTARSIEYVSDFENNVELYGEEANQYVEKILMMETTTAEILKGSTANKGIVTGVARVFRYGYDNWDSVKKMIKEMKEGEILIAETTSPELLVACKKASTILTNQGGMMSHAAIVSRELGIPCVVGLGNATHVIHTGDTLVVDGGNGVVKIKARA